MLQCLYLANYQAKRKLNKSQSCRYDIKKLMNGCLFLP